MLPRKVLLPVTIAAGLVAAGDDGDATQAARTANVIRRQMSAAWRGAKYYIKSAAPR
jgi:hypothetical protein